MARGYVNSMVVAVKASDPISSPVGPLVARAFLTISAPTDWSRVLTLGVPEVKLRDLFYRRHPFS
jgi:hypothetical protein